MTLSRIKTYFYTLKRVNGVACHPDMVGPVKGRVFDIFCSGWHARVLEAETATGGAARGDATMDQSDIRGLDTT